MSDQYDRLIYTIVSAPHSTAAGVQLRTRDGNDREDTNWFPKSQVDYDDQEVSMPRWLALDKGLGVPVRESTQHDARRDDE